MLARRLSSPWMNLKAQYLDKSLLSHGIEEMNSASKKPLSKSSVIRLLKQEKPFLAREFSVTELALFGSISRDDAESGSDVDILVKFDGPATSRRYFGVQFHLEDLLGRPVDLVTEKALRPELRPYIEDEAVYVQ